MSSSGRDSKQSPPNSAATIALLLNVPVNNVKPAHLKSDQQQSLINIGDGANDYANSIIKVCFTHPNYQKGKSDSQLTAAFDQSNTERENLNWIKGDVVERPGVAKPTAFSSIQEDAQKIMQHKTGQCFEYSVLVFKHILDRINKGEKNINAHLMTVEDGDHTFIILDKSPHEAKATDPYYPFSNDAVVVDAWDNKVYPIQEIIGKLKYPIYDDDKKEQGIRSVVGLKPIEKLKEITPELSTDQVLLAEKLRLSSAAQPSAAPANSISNAASK